MLKFHNNAKFRQYTAVITVNLCVLATGAGLIWSSPVLVKLSNNSQTVLKQPLTEEEGSWIVSIGCLSGIIASLIIPFLGDIVGSKYGLILACFPRVVASIFFIWASDVWMLLLGRAIAGVSDNAIFTLVPMYASEIANKDIRGSLGSILQIQCSIGVVIMLSMGPFMSYINLNMTLFCIIILTTLPLLFLPDSPYFLYSKGKKEEALKVLTFYRCSESLAHEELKDYEAEGLRYENVNKDILKDKLFLKSLFLVIILGLSSQLNGFNAILFYLQTILESTQTTVMPEIASIIIGLIQLLASFGTTCMTDKFGRKPILTVTSLGMALGMITLGIFFKLKESDSVDGFLNYMPLLSLIVVVYCFSAGFGSLYFVVAAELFTDKSRSIGMSTSLITLTFSIFLTTKYFTVLTSSIGPVYMYWGFSMNCILTCLFIKFFIPETKGKSFNEIQDILRNKNNKNQCEIF